MVFIDRLIERIIEKKNPSVVGLDTQIGFVPDGIREACANEYGDGVRAAAEAIYRFNLRTIDSVKDIVPAVKLQSAFYELYGMYGAEAFIKTAEYARESGLIVIADVKRNDIGSTAEAYADAFLGGDGRAGGDAGEGGGAGGGGGADAGAGGGTGTEANAGTYFADAITVNPYLGFDGIEPFLNNCRKNDKGIFILVKTSNPSSGDFQDLELAGGLRLYEHVASKIEEWALGEGLLGTYGYSSVCAVVGATYPEQTRVLRERLKRIYFLVPGFGAQGGGADDAGAAFDSSGLGAIVNASRSILCAWSHERWGGKYTHDDFDEAAKAEALRMKTEINNAIWIK